MSPELWVILTAMLAASACGLIGSFLVLRRNAMLGDAVSHAVLPGLVLGYLVTASRDVLPMLIGAGVMGLLTAYLTELLSRTGRLYRDAALGVVFTLLFAVGVILVASYTGHVDLDQECVLYGEVAYTPFDTIALGGTNLGPRAFWILSGVLLADLLFVLLFFKQLKISSFDPAFARAVGLNERLWHYLLMSMVALTVVASFESVGAILVVAMLIIPGATAHLLTSRLTPFLFVAVTVGIGSAVGGYYAAAVYDASIAGFMAVVGGGVFALTLTATRVVQRLHARTAAREEFLPAGPASPEI